MASATSPARLMLIGAGAGMAWGVLLRLWMRLVSTDPEFTWTGTGMILGFATLAGALLGVAAARRRLGRRGWWRLNGLAILGLGLGAGIVMLPSVLLGGLALGRTTWNRWARMALAAAAVAVQVLVFTQESLGDFSLPRVIAAFGSYAVLLGTEAWAASIVFRPRVVHAG